ncbi:MAG: 23S rRNA (uracil(1939)-C(5))-methyltransferase RlmD [Candidatus Kapabacteria bacterium]|nr:23S rRNA (uracil(1939)-C(5))-methyltransferase RlmD [Candidatus Kapabacteria bacterium]
MSRTSEIKFVELEIESAAFTGVGVARLDNLVYFVKGAVPGDIVKARIIKKKKKHCEAVIEEIIVPSAHRIEPICSHFGICGGCSWQNLDYSQQIFWKRQHVIDSFQRIAGLNVETYNETVPSERQFFFRNKMEFSFGDSRWLTDEEIQSESEIHNKNFALGLHIAGRFDKILDIQECYIQPEFGNKILNLIRNKALEFDVKAYNLKSHNGFLRNLIIRSSLYSSEMMIILLTDEIKEESDKKFLNWYYEEFSKEMPENISVLHSFHTGFSPVYFGDYIIIKGKDYLIEEIDGIKFRISPFSFFQTNSYQLNKFIKYIVNSADITSDSIVWDLYCGAGSITLPASKRAKEIFGFEISESSIKDANTNKEMNNIENANFYSIDLHSKEISSKLKEFPEPVRIIIDPPRAGMHKNLIQVIKEIAPPKIVYVSCNPTTQARDCAELSEIFEVKSVTPFDMFPQTYHIESIAVLERKLRQSYDKNL